MKPFTLQLLHLLLCIHMFGLLAMNQSQRHIDNYLVEPLLMCQAEANDEHCVAACAWACPSVLMQL